MGHLDQVWQGTRSTQPQTPTSTTIPTMPNLHTDDHIAKAPQAPLNARTNHVFMQVHAIDGVIFSNQTGRFPITSNRGKAYIVVFYVYDANYIHSIPIKSRSKEVLLRAYHEVYEWLLVRGFKPLLHKMDNETLHEVEKFIQGQQTCLQYTPPDMHCTNPAERVIRTWKNHFLAGIAGLPKSFPIANWCRLTKQCDTTLNMLRPCHQNPLLSAHEALEGSFSFDATPMASLGTEVLVHMKPYQCSTWGYHTSKAWYLSHSPNHYRCIQVLMANSSGKRITHTFRFNYHSIPVPKITATDRILDTTTRRTAAIEGVQEAPPNELATIQALRTLLLGEVPPPEPTPAPVTAPRPTIDEEPVVIWSPDDGQQPAHDTGTNSPASAPPSRRDLPAIIEDDSDDESIPPTLLRRSPWVHAAPSTTTACTCYVLLLEGYHGDVMRVTLKPIKCTTVITASHTQERIELLSQAKAHGSIFSATGDIHLTANGIFLSIALKQCKILHEKLGKGKTLRERQEKNESVALDILQRKGEDPTTLTGTDLTALLTWHQHPKVASLKKDAKYMKYCK